MATWRGPCYRAGMATTKDPGFTVRVPASTLGKLRKIAEKQAKKSPLLSETDALRIICQRALALGAEDPRLCERATEADV